MAAHNWDLRAYQNTASSWLRRLTSTVFVYSFKHPCSSMFGLNLAFVHWDFFSPWTYCWHLRSRSLNTGWLLLYLFPCFWPIFSSESLSALVTLLFLSSGKRTFLRHRCETEAGSYYHIPSALLLHTHSLKSQVLHVSRVGFFFNNPSSPDEFVNENEVLRPQKNSERGNNRHKSPLPRSQHLELFAAHSDAEVSDASLACTSAVVQACCVTL